LLAPAMMARHRKIPNEILKQRKISLTF
jgi:hypothetical protein